METGPAVSVFKVLLQDASYLPCVAYMHAYVGMNQPINACRYAYIKSDIQAALEIGIGRRVHCRSLMLWQRCLEDRGTLNLSVSAVSVEVFEMRYKSITHDKAGWAVSGSTDPCNRGASGIRNFRVGVQRCM